MWTWINWALLGGKCGLGAIEHCWVENVGLDQLSTVGWKMWTWINWALLGGRCGLGKSAVNSTGSFDSQGDHVLTLGRFEICMWQSQVRFEIWMWQPQERFENWMWQSQVRFEIWMRQSQVRLEIWPYRTRVRSRHHELYRTRNIQLHNNIYYVMATTIIYNNCNCKIEKK